MGKIKLESMKLLLDRFDPIYNPEDYVTGKCVITLNGEMNLNRLEIKLFGLAQVRTRLNGMSAKEKARGSGVYYSQYQCIDLSYWPAKLNPKIITCGEHSIPFAFQLPNSDIPSSFEGKWGHIRYNIEAEIHKPSVLTINHRVSTPFRVISPAFASIEELIAPIGSYKAKSIGYFCFKRETFILSASIDHCGQYAGKLAIIHCKISNRSNKWVRLKAILKQRVVYHDRGITRVDNKYKLSCVKGELIAPTIDTVIDTQLHLPIPYGLPVLHNQCPIITINHVITVTLDIPNTIDIHVELPIIVTN